MSIRLPSSLGTLWCRTQTVPGGYLAPVLSGGGETLAMTLIKSGPEPAIGGQAILRNEDDVTPMGGGGTPTLGDLMMTWGTIELSASALHIAANVASADWLPILRACYLSETNPDTLLSGDGSIRFAPALAPAIVAADNSGTPKVASWTWRDTGAPTVAQVWRSQDVVGRIASISSGADGDIRIAVEAMGLWYRASNVADAVTTATAASLTGAPTLVSRALHPVFRLAGATWTVAGGSGNTAELLGSACVHDFSFDPGMSLEPQPCLQETDGFAPAFSYQTGQAVLSVQVSIPPEAGTDTAVIAAMLRELAGDTITLEWTRATSTVTWTFTLRLHRFRVLSVARSDSAGARTYQVEVAGRPDPATSGPAWDITWKRDEP